MKKKYTLHIYWEDGQTIECRYFWSWKEAKAYAKQNGVENYKID